jgi:hypothetical protein
METRDGRKGLEVEPPMRRRRGISAWLVTWEAMSEGSAAKVQQRIAAILNPRWSDRRVEELVELLYANATYSLDERIALVRGTWKNPYPVRYGTLNGVPWTGRMVCGHNPFLEARLVDDLRVVVNDDGTERPVWKERPKPHFPLSARNPSK